MVGKLLREGHTVHACDLDLTGMEKGMLLLLLRILLLSKVLISSLAHKEDGWGDTKGTVHMHHLSK